MATSAKQIAANRRNTRKSTGPRTSEGKAVASRNDPDDHDPDSETTARHNANLVGSQIGSTQVVSHQPPILRDAPRPPTHPRLPIFVSPPTYAGLGITTEPIIRT